MSATLSEARGSLRTAALALAGFCLVLDMMLDADRGQGVDQRRGAWPKVAQVSQREVHKGSGTS